MSDFNIIGSVIERLKSCCNALEGSYYTEFKRAYSKDISTLVNLDMEYGYTVGSPEDSLSIEVTIVFKVTMFKEFDITKEFIKMHKDCYQNLRSHSVTSAFGDLFLRDLQTVEQNYDLSNRVLTIFDKFSFTIDRG